MKTYTLERIKALLYSIAYITLASCTTLPQPNPQPSTLPSYVPQPTPMPTYRSTIDINGNCRCEVWDWQDMGPGDGDE